MTWYQDSYQTTCSIRETFPFQHALPSSHWACWAQHPPPQVVWQQTASHTLQRNAWLCSRRCQWRWGQPPGWGGRIPHAHGRSWTHGSRQSAWDDLQARNIRFITVNGLHKALNGLAQDCSNSIANVMELLQSCSHLYHIFHRYWISNEKKSNTCYYTLTEA